MSEPRTFSVWRAKGGRDRHSDSHASWNDAPDTTCCGYPMPKGFALTHEARPECKKCQSAINKELKVVEDGGFNGLIPGNTTRVPLSKLYPPVVERVSIPVNLDMYDIHPGDKTDIGALWELALEAFAKVDPTPVVEQERFRRAVNQIDTITVTPYAFLVPLAHGDFPVLAPFRPNLETILHELGASREQAFFVGQMFAPTQPTKIPEVPVEELKTVPAADAPDKRPVGRYTRPQVDYALTRHEKLALIAENRSAIWSRLMIERHRLAREKNLDAKTAHNLAYPYVAAHIIDPPVDEQTLRKFLAPANAGIGLNQTHDPNTTIIGLVRSWCLNNDYLPKSPALAHFGGKTHGAYDSARRTLGETEGFLFEDKGPYWAVTRPKSPEELALEQLEQQQRQFAEQQRQLTEQIAALRAKLAGK